MNLLYFTYTNHRNEEHTYLIMPEPRLDFIGVQDGHLSWTIHGHVLERDGESRPGRRSFKLNGLRDLVEIVP